MYDELCSHINYYYYVLTFVHYTHTFTISIGIECSEVI